MAKTKGGSPKEEPVKPFDARVDVPAETAKLMEDYKVRWDDAYDHFWNRIKPRFDRSYMLYMSWPETRRGLIDEWQTNLFVPFTNSSVEAIMPRVVDARPEFNALARNQEAAERVQSVNHIADFNWEIAGGDATNEELVKSDLVYGGGWLEQSYRVKKRKHRKFKGKGVEEIGDMSKWGEEEDVIVYDAPYWRCLDPYTVIYDHRNVRFEDKSDFFIRMMMDEDAIRRDFPYLDETLLAKALAAEPHDSSDWGEIRTRDRRNETERSRGNYGGSGDPRYLNSAGRSTERFGDGRSNGIRFHEVKVWKRQHRNDSLVVINEVPCTKAPVPNVHEHGETGLIYVPYASVPFEFEGMSLPEQIDGLQMMVNVIKNQRIDSALLNIHKMWRVNPNAGIDKRQLQVRPFGIVWTQDPNGVAPIEFSDVKPSAYQEESMLKQDMAYATGIDDASRGVQSGGSATEVRHLREATLERLRLFINHLGDGYSKLFRMVISDWRQFMPDQVAIRVTGKDGTTIHTIIGKDDIKGEFDYRSQVLPSIAGKNDVERKQAMDLVQLLLPVAQAAGISPREVIAWVASKFNVSLESFTDRGAAGQGMPGQGAPGQAVPGQEGGQVSPDLEAYMSEEGSGPINDDTMAEVLAKFGLSPGMAQQGGQSQFAALNRPMELDPNVMPASVPDTTNPRGLSRGPGAKVNTALPGSRGNSDQETNILSDAGRV